jgi:signal transduction histidine kinase
MIAHEINNLLTPLKSYASLALNHPDDAALTQKALQKTAANCDRASKVTESMLALADGKRQQEQNSRLGDLVEEIFTCLCRDFTKDGISVDVRIPDGLAVWGVPVQIQQALMNLILNARDAMLGRGGVLNIRAAQNAGAVEIVVADTGQGITQTDLDSIFETFFTTKTQESPARHSGTGLGLAFCKMIVDGHGGHISVESTPGQGSSFTITLPQP